MSLHELIGMAKANGASDLHLEPGLSGGDPGAGDVAGDGRADPPASCYWRRRVRLSARRGWEEFLARRFRMICRKNNPGRPGAASNVMHTSRGVGLGGAVV